jgi:hypothetical protein
MKASWQVAFVAFLALACTAQPPPVATPTVCSSTCFAVREPVLQAKQCRCSCSTDEAFPQPERTSCRSTCVSEPGELVQCSCSCSFTDKEEDIK